MNTNDASPKAEHQERPRWVQGKLSVEAYEDLLFGRFGVISDDTEHALITSRALLESADKEVAFGRALSRRLIKGPLPAEGRPHFAGALNHIQMMDNRVALPTPGGKV